VRRIDRQRGVAFTLPVFSNGGRRIQIDKADMGFSYHDHYQSSLDTYRVVQHHGYVSSILLQEIDSARPSAGIFFAGSLYDRERGSGPPSKLDGLPFPAPPASVVIPVCLMTTPAWLMRACRAHLAQRLCQDYPRATFEAGI
jgi:hypothetical protein